MRLTLRLSVASKPAMPALCMAEPAATEVLAYVILGERMETMQIVGAIAVIVGVLVLQLGPESLVKPPPSHREEA